MNTIKNLIILTIASASLPAMARINFVIDSPLEISATHNVCQPAKVQERTAVESKLPTEIASDYDFQYYWLDNSGTISNTWETSITEIVSGEKPGEYYIEGLLADTFRDAIAASGSKVDRIAATYDAATGTLDIACGQHLFDFKNSGTVIPLSILAITKAEKGWRISKDGTLKLTHTDRGFATAETSDVVGLFIGNITPQNRVQGFGGALYPALNEFNGVMLFSVTPNLETEPLPQLCDIYSEVKDGKLHIYNFANFGYHVDMTIDYSLSERKAWAKDAVIDYLLDSDGIPTPFYAANSLSGNQYGDPERDDKGQYVFSAQIATDDLGNNVLQPNPWGAYIANNFIGLYSNTNIMLFYPLPKDSGVTAPITTEDGQAEYYNLQGILVDEPIHGKLYIRRQGSSVSKIIF